MADASKPSEKLVLGRQMVKEFIGEYRLKAINANMVSLPIEAPMPNLHEVLESLRLTMGQRDDIFTRTSAEFIAEVCFSGYARPGLEFKDRALMNIAMLIALGRAPELRIHIRAAFDNGWTEEQICEACRHAMVYCGVPAGRDALIIASEIFEDLRQSGEYGKKA
ncbi:hypothetical protein LTR84_007499 [Exophiala bonariae]|uniref:Carboxymuconolactone decarboxylase-like domain-containing protein n=1 Tax=Exophiala bonariae TaxID=1690606 RepID=A0AAV9N1R1_9EURO|nr:hypothetical protein LTR84_007499 [Exophiala bonariae]